MSFEQQVRKIEADLTQQFKKLLSPTKKNIVFFCPYGIYHKNFGTLAKKLGEKHNVILARCNSLSANFEAQFAAAISVAWLAETPEGDIPIRLDIEGIDLIIINDSLEDEPYAATEFLSKTAKRVYMPHSMLQAPKNAAYDYIIAPTKIFVEDYQRIHTKTDNLILAGYPKFDHALMQNTEQKPDKITYAATFRNDMTDKTMYISLLNAGYDANLLEWLLENTNQKIAYRPHPIAYQGKGVQAYQLLKSRFAAESRLSFDETPGSGFYAQTQTLITDFSTTAYTFSLSTLRPSIFFAPMQGDRAIGKHIHRIGTIAKNFRELKQILNKNEDKSQEIAAFRDECVFNVGKSEEAICEAIDSILNT